MWGSSLPAKSIVVPLYGDVLITCGHAFRISLSWSIHTRVADQRNSKFEQF
jgi:hypothetical protein